MLHAAFRTVNAGRFSFIGAIIWKLFLAPSADPMPLPAPNTHNTIDKLNELWNSAHRHFDAGDLRLGQVERLARALLKSDPASGYSVLSGVAALSGNVKSTRDYADKAARLSSEPDLALNKSSMLANLGYFAESGHLFRRLLTVDRLPMRHIGEQAIANGSILAIDDALTKAGKMPTAVPEPLRNSIAVAASILRRNNVTDDDVGAWLDGAGDLMRENKFFYIDYPRLFATLEEDFGQVDLSYMLDVDSAHAADLNRRLAERCFDAGIAPPECFSFGFSSYLQLNGRLAA